MGRSDWKTSSETVALLQCSVDHLNRLRKRKTIKHKKHWINLSPGAARPTYRYNVPAILRHLESLQDELEKFTAHGVDQPDP